MHFQLFMNRRGVGHVLAGLLLLASGCEVPADGEAGAPGADGVDGVRGQAGPAGEPGAPGAEGPAGQVGEAGQEGQPGEDGVAGVDGQDGRDGRDGQDGRDGRDALAGTLLDARVAPVALALSRTGHDRLYGVTYDAAGNIFATGHIANDISGDADFSLLLAKFLPNGELDPSFGNDGVVTHNVAVGGGGRERARGVVVQSTGHIVIAGAAEHDPAAAGLLANDTDIVLVRFDAGGAVDASFGTDGLVRLDLNEGVLGLDRRGNEALVGGDSQWSLSLAADDKLVVHGATRASGFEGDGVTLRSDSDWALVRLQADGALDVGFGDGGVVTLDIGGAGASSRTASVLPDGSIVAAGYLTSDVLGVSSQQPVIYKVDTHGDFDATFATGDAWAADGVWHDLAVAPPLRAEAYGAALQGERLVTMGYGATNGAGTGSDWISLRYTADGELDTTYGTSGAGATYIDAGGYSDNGRAVLVLPDNRVLGLGGGREAPSEPLAEGQPETDAMLAVLTENGVPDESFAMDGFELYDMGGRDFFWAGAVSPNQQYVAIVGIAGAVQAGVNDDDALLYVMPMPD